MRCVELILCAATLVAGRGFCGEATFSDIPGADSSTNRSADSSTNSLDQIIAVASSYESGQSLEAFRRLDEGVRAAVAKPGLRKEMEAGLIKLLGTNSTFEARKFACKELGIIGGQAALPALGRMLADPDTTSLACLALTTYPPGKADEVLRTELKFSTGPAKIQILNTLGDRRDGKSVQLLSAHATDPDGAVAAAAVGALGKIGTRAAWNALNAIPKKSGIDPSAAMTDARLRFAEEQHRAGDAKAAASVYEELLAKSQNAAVRRSSLSALLELDHDGGLQRIVEILSGPDEALKPVAIARVASVPGRDATEKFAAQLHHLRPEDQALLLSSLAARNDPVSRLELAKSFSSTEPALRRAAITAAGRLGDPYFLGLLAQAAASASEPEESRAVEAALIALTGGTATDRRMINELKTAPSKARVQLIAAISRRQGPAANTVFLEEADNSDAAVAKAALRALARTGGPGEASNVVAKVVSLRDAGVRSEAQSTARQVLARIHNPSRRTALVREALGRTTSVDNRVTLIELLPACADAGALPILTTSMKDSEPQVRDAAIRALADWPDDSVWGALLSVYRQPENETTRRVALDGLARLLGEENPRPDAKLVDRYRELLAGARSEADLKLVLGVMSGAAEPGVLNLVLPMLSNTSIHPEAAAAAKKIAEAIKAQHPELAEEALKRVQGDASKGTE